jgi:hypothetical protein
VTQPEQQPAVVDKRDHLIKAAMVGVQLYLTSSAGKEEFGENARLVVCDKAGFAVWYGNDDVVYFDVTELP